MAGVPFIAKDNFLTEGHETTAASNILKGFVPPFNATSIQKLLDEDAVLVAKANLDAFAHGSSTENSDFGVTKNPHDETRVPGGSSGGSAAAVVLEMAPFALGTDTGGSIRLPASFTGCVGYKPTYGLVSRYGVVAMASSTDVIGPLTNNVDDAALVLDVMSGKDQLDSTTIERDEAEYTHMHGDLKGLKVGVIKEHMTGDVATGVKKEIDAAIERLKQAGADIKEISIPELDLALAVYYIVMPAEVSSNLSRYDGIRYGASERRDTLDATYTETRSKNLNDEVTRRIMIGTYVLSSGYYDAYYKKAQQVRTKLIERFNEVFEDVDVLLGPTAPGTAFKIGENTKDPLQMYLTDIMTVAPNLVGTPAVSLPTGMSDKLPVGLHLVAPQRHDRQLLGVAKAYTDLLEGEA